MTDDSYILVHGRRFPIEWDEGGAYWTVGLIPKCPQCGETLDNGRVENKAPVQVVRGVGGAVVCMECGETLPIQEKE